MFHFWQKLREQDGIQCFQLGFFSNCKGDWKIPFERRTSTHREHALPSLGGDVSRDEGRSRFFVSFTYALKRRHTKNTLSTPQMKVQIPVYNKRHTKFKAETKWINKIIKKRVQKSQRMMKSALDFRPLQSCNVTPSTEILRMTGVWQILSFLQGQTKSKVSLKWTQFYTGNSRKNISLVIVNLYS